MKDEEFVKIGIGTIQFELTLLTAQQIIEWKYFFNDLIPIRRISNSHEIRKKSDLIRLK